MKTLRTLAHRLALVASVALACVASGAPAAAAETPTKLRMSVNDPLIPALAESLGNLKREGLEVAIVKVEDVSEHDYLMQEPLVKGRLDVSFHWFQHVVFGARHNLPLKAVMLINDSPGMKVVVANRVKDQIKSAADFKGRNIAEGAGYATKSVLVNYLARRAGLPPNSYTPVMKETEGRQQAVIAGLSAGKVDVMAFMEPITSAIEKTGLTATLYDLTNREGTVKALGDVWPVHTLFLSTKYIDEHPETVQHLVNAYVRTMRFVNSHTAEQIVAKLPDSYFAKTDRQSETTRVAKLLPGFTRGNYALTPSSVELVIDVVKHSAFDDSDEGQFRATGENNTFKPEDLYTNQFVDKAMKTIP
jgi:NitT/TauT family transport system substrate-binding protein